MPSFTGNRIGCNDLVINEGFICEMRSLLQLPECLPSVPNLLSMTRSGWAGVPLSRASRAYLWAFLGTSRPHHTSSANAIASGHPTPIATEMVSVGGNVGAICLEDEAWLVSRFSIRGRAGRGTFLHDSVCVGAGLFICSLRPQGWSRRSGYRKSYLTSTN